MTPTQTARDVLGWRIDPDKEQKWLLREQGHPIGPDDATLCEMDLWREIQLISTALEAREREIEELCRVATETELTYRSAVECGYIAEIDIEACDKLCSALVAVRGKK